MSTVTSTPDETTDERSLTDRYGRFAGPLVLAGAALLIISAFLSWSYDPGPLGNVRPYGNPAPTQYFAIILGVLGLAFWFGVAHCARSSPGSTPPRHSSPSATARWPSPCS